MKPTPPEGTARSAFSNEIARIVWSTDNHEQLEIELETARRIFELSLSKELCEKIEQTYPHGSEINYEEDNEAAGRAHSKNEDIAIIKAVLEASPSDV